MQLKSVSTGFFFFFSLLTWYSVAPHRCLGRCFVLEMHAQHLLPICFLKWQCVRGTHAREPQDLTIALEVWSFGPRAKAPHRNTGNDISYVFRTEGGREIEGWRGRKRERERECWESEWEFLSGNRAVTVSYYREKRRKRRGVNVGKGSGGLCSRALFSVQLLV